MDFAIRLVNSDLGLPDRKGKFLGEFLLQKNSNQSCSSNFGEMGMEVGGLHVVKMTRGIVHVSFSLPEWQAVKLTFFTPCRRK